MPPSKPDTSAPHLWLIFWRAFHSLQQWDRASIASLNLDLTDFAILETLYHKGPQRVNEIGRRVLLTSGSITTALQRMEKRGLITRQSDPKDTRASRILLSEQGRDTIRKAYPSHEKNLEQVFDLLSKKEKKELYRLLKKVGLQAHELANNNKEQQS